MTKLRHIFNKRKKLLLIFTPIITLFALAFLSQKIYAYNHNEYSANGIRYYNPDECNRDGGGTQTHLSGNTIDEKIWNYLISKGFNDAQAAGIMGNFEAESGNNPLREANDICWGIAMICRESGQYEASRQAFQDAGYGSYVGHPTAYSGPGGEENIPAEDLDGILQLAIDWILKICDENKYIFNGTYTEWIKTAQSPEEAAEIFTITYERPVCYKSKWGARCVRPEHVGSNWNTKYDGYQDLDRRRQHAREFYDLYAGSGTTADSTSTSLGSSDGANVTIIGDSITTASESSIKSKLPNADIRAQVSKHMFMDGGTDTGGDSGAKILDDIIKNSEQRDVLIIALGTNDPGALSQSQLQTEIVDKAKDANVSKIIFVNNAEVVDSEAYAKNNEVLRNLANANPNVDVADWAAVVKGNPGLLNANDVHPTAEGAEAYAKLMYNAIGSLIGSSTGKSSNCNCSNDSGSGSGGGGGTLTGGLTEEQAQRLADDYNTGPISRWSTGSSYDVLNNCVSFSKYITRVMTDLTWNGGNGRETVDKLASANSGLETGKEPRPFSIFQTENHTGFIVAVNGEDVLAVEAAWPFTGHPDGYKGKLRKYKLSTLSSGAYKFAYIESHLNSTFYDVVGGTSSVSTTTAESAALVSASWQDGWITQGIEGYKKEDYKSAGVNPIDNSMDGNYTTTSPKNGTMGPNKITLHSVEGKNESSGIAVYNSGSAPLSHFTIDLKNKKTYQHLPINKPACGVASHDDTAGVQIEIMGFSTTSSGGFSDDWYLQNDSAFGEPEWAYLAKLLVAISEETGISLSSSVDWKSPSRLDSTAFESYTGVLGHMHVPDNSHTDPGNIWGKLSEQLGKVRAGKTDGSCNELSSSTTWQGDFPFMFQCEGIWSSSKFAGGTFCGAGCGVTSFAMVATALTGELVTPPDLIKIEDCDTTSNAPTCFKNWSNHFGFEYEHFSTTMKLTSKSSTEEIKQAFEKYLKDGYIVITSGHSNGSFSNANRNPFSSSGHFVVFYGIDSSGNWLIADPAGRNRDWAAECTDIAKCTPRDNAMNPEQIIKVGIQRTDGTGVRAYAFKK